jgi:cytochrome c oxidase subunit II
MITAQIQLFPEQASTIAPRVDAVLFYVLGLSIFFSILIASLVIYFAVRYRRRSPNEVPAAIHGSTSLEIFWTVTPLILVLILFAWGANVFFALARPPDDALEIYVVGRQWMWKIQHPEGQREINTLHIPIGQPVKLTMTSEDVIHSFFVPAFRTKQDVVPGRFSTTWFEATKTGTFRLFCAEYCGTEHAKMVGSVIVMKRDDYQKWLQEGAEGSLALQGRKLFTKLQCITCHGANPQARAPVLEGIFHTMVPLNDGRNVLADDNYLRESIMQPAAKVVAGFQPIMPTFQGLIKEDELVELIAYIKSLKRGQTPPRVEETMPPEVLPVVPARGEKQP